MGVSWLWLDVRPLLPADRAAAQTAAPQAEEMDDQNIEITTRCRDGGVEVIAEIELGIASVREALQAKRHRRTMQRKNLDSRGLLPHLFTVRGTVIAPSRFSKSAEEAIFAADAASVTIIDGGKRFDLLFEHGFAVRKRTLDVLTVDRHTFADLEGNA